MDFRQGLPVFVLSSQLIIPGDAPTSRLPSWGTYAQSNSTVSSAVEGRVDERIGRTFVVEDATASDDSTPTTFGASLHWLLSQQTAVEQEPDFEQDAIAATDVETTAVASTEPVETDLAWWNWVTPQSRTTLFDTVIPPASQTVESILLPQDHASSLLPTVATWTGIASIGDQPSIHFSRDSVDSPMSTQVMSDRTPAIASNSGQPITSTTPLDRAGVEGGSHDKSLDPIQLTSGGDPVSPEVAYPRSWLTALDGAVASNEEASHDGEAEATNGTRPTNIETPALPSGTALPPPIRTSRTEAALIPRAASVDVDTSSSITTDPESSAIASMGASPEVADNATDDAADDDAHAQQDAARDAGSPESSQLGDALEWNPQTSWLDQFSTGPQGSRLTLTEHVSRTLASALTQAEVETDSGMSFQIDIPDAGELSIHLRRHDRGLVVQVFVENPVTLEMLQLRTHQIESTLRDAALDVHDLRFDSGQGTSASGDPGSNPSRHSDPVPSIESERSFDAGRESRGHTAKQKTTSRDMLFRA